MTDNIYEQENHSNMYEEMTPRSENVKQLKMTERLTDTIERGQDVSELTQEIDLTPEEIDMKVLDEGQKERISDVSKLISDIGVTRADLLETVSTKFIESEIPVRDVTKNIIKKHEELIRSRANSSALTEKEIKDNAVRSAVMEHIASKLDDESIWGKITDFAEMMIYDDSFVNHARVFGDLKGEQEAWDYVNSGRVIKDLVDFGKSLPPESRAEYQMWMVDQFFEEHDHNKVLALINSLEALGESPLSDVVFFDAVNKVFLGLGIVNAPKLIMKGIQGLNAIRNAAKLKQLDAAAVLTEASKNPDLAKKLGISEVDAASIGNPLSGEKTLNNSVPDKEKAEILMRLQDVDEALARGENIIDTELFATEAERAFIAQAVKKKFGKNSMIDDVEITPDEAGKGINVKFKLTDPSTGVSEIEKNIPFTYDQLGGLVDEGVNLGLELTPLSGEVASPNALLGLDKETFVQQLEANMLARSKKSKAFADAFGSALKGLSKRNKKRINNVLASLEGKDIQLTYDLLVNQGVGGIRLSPKEYGSVLAVRRTFDSLFSENNKAIRSEYVRQGLKGVSIDGAEMIAKSYDDKAAATLTLVKAREKGEHWIYVPDKDQVKHFPYTPEALEDYMDKGYVLVDAGANKAHEWFSLGKGEVSRFALVPKDAVGDLPEMVLRKTPNYIPRRRKEGNFFVKELNEVKLGSGVTKRTERTVAWAHTKSQALKWIEKRNKLAEELGESTKELNVVADRGKGSVAVSEEDVVRTYGGLYTGKRSSREIEFAGDNVNDAEYINPLDTLQHALQNTADRVTMSAWRQANKKRWLNEASAYIPNITDEPFNEALGRVKESKLPAAVKKKLIAAHEQITFHSGVPTKAEQKLQGFFRSLGESADRGDFPKVAKFMYRIEDSNPINLMRSMAYHSVLGMFNIAQIPIQLAGALNALAISPRSAPKALGKWLSASVLDGSSNINTTRQTLKILGKELELGDWSKDYKFWRKSGYMDSIRMANADTAAVLDKMPYDAGLLRRVWGGFLRAGEVPYQMGELANMRISFFTALEDIKRTTPNFAYTDQNLRKVIARAEKMRMNMSAANKANFQKGLLALPTQFKQIFTKFAETLLIRESKGGFTAGEKARMVLTQMALFGYAGVPFVSSGIDKIASMFFVEEDLENMDPDKVILARRGTLGLLTNSYFDIDAAFSGRLTTSTDLVQEAVDMVTKEVPLYQSLGGVFYSTADKFITSLNYLATAGSILYNQEFNEKTFNTALEIVQTAMLNTTASGRKWIEANLLQERGILKAGSQSIRAQMGDKQWEDVLARRLGFSSQKASDYWSLKKDFREYQETLNDIGTFYGTLLRDGMTKALDDPESIAIYQGILADTMQGIKDLPPEDQKTVLDAVERFTQDTTFEGETMNDWLLQLNNPEIKATTKTNILGLQMAKPSKDEEKD